MNPDFTIVEQLDFEGGTVRVTEDVSALPALKQHYIQQARQFDEDGKGIDAVYFSGEYPSVYFKWVPSFTPEMVRSVVRIQRKVWNQGKVPFLYVESPSEIRIYNCYEKPQKDDQPDAERTLLSIVPLPKMTRHSTTYTSFGLFLIR